MGIYTIFLIKGEVYIPIWNKNSKPEKKKDGKKSQPNVIAAAGHLCSAGIAGAGFPCARNACMRTHGA